MAKEFERPELTLDDKTTAAKFAQKAAQQGFRKTLTYLVALCLENIRLMKEVNQHRERLGYEQLPIYKP